MIKLNLDKSKRYLLACSFGPDSMALFHILRENGYIFECAIVNYHLRKESDKEVNSLLQYSSRFNIKVHALNVVEKIDKNIESKCRDIRYHFFKELIDKFGFDSVLVAQHQDDHIETYILQKQRQNYPIFYGIAEKTMIFGVNVIRPLLAYIKQDLLDVCQKNNVPFSIDQSNFDTKIKRNKIRHEIVGKMSAQERQRILNKIDIENKELNKILSSLNKDKLCEVDYALSLDKVPLAYALNYYLKKIDNSLYLSSNNVGQVISILKSAKPNGQFPIKSRVFLIKEYGYFTFSTDRLYDVNYSYCIKSPLKLDTPYFYLDFTRDTSNRNVSKHDYPLTIRHLCRTDYIFINGYRVDANRLMIDWKVPFRKRLIWPVIVNKDGKCIYIPRYQKSFKPDSDTNFYVK